MEGLMGAMLENWRDKVRDRSYQRGTLSGTEGGPWCSGPGLHENS